MNILHITYTLDEGGVDTLLLEMLPYIHRKGANIDLLVLKKGNNKLVEQIKEQGIRVLNGRYRNIYDIRNIIFIYNLFHLYDIVHCHLFPIQYFVGIASIFKKNIPIIITTEHCTTNRRRSIKFLRPLEKFIYSKYDKIICISKAAANNLIQWVGLNHKVIRIDNGINLSRILNAQPLTKEDIGISDDSIVIMMVARFFAQKDHKTAIRAMKYLSNKNKLVFVGSGEMIEACKSYVADRRLRDRVIFLGNRQDIPSLIKCADIGLLSSNFEGLPISLIEFCSAGIPIVGTRIDGIKELVNDDNLLFTIGNEMELSKCIKYLSNSDTYQSASEINRINSLNYSIEKTANQYFLIYQTMYNDIKYKHSNS